MNNLKLAEIFSDRTVFQHSKPIRVFGRAFGNVTVCFDGECNTVKAEGKWIAEFDARPAGGPYTLTVTCGNESVTLSDIMVGEVILFSGQSNIQMHMSDETTPVPQYVRDPLLRIFVSDRLEKEEVYTPKDGWLSAVPEQIPGWSAVAYHAGLETRKACGCAVGVIACSQGASCIQAWIDRALFSGDDEPLSIHYNPDERFGLWNDPGRLYDYMLTPLLPYSVSSVVWLQGESNVHPEESPHYARCLELLCECWRKGFCDETLPFVIIGIHDYEMLAGNPNWKIVQDAQEDAPNHIHDTAYVRSGDICETFDIHPPTKSMLARRVVNTLCKKGWLSASVE
nr:hypothetical protein [Clostridia bacterium]